MDSLVEIESKVIVERTRAGLGVAETLGVAVPTLYRWVPASAHS